MSRQSICVFQQFIEKRDFDIHVMPETMFEVFAFPSQPDPHWVKTLIQNFEYLGHHHYSLKQRQVLIGKKK